MTDQLRNAAIDGRFDASTGIATLTLAMEGRANKINDTFGLGFREALEWAQGLDGLRGILIASAHRDWCVGADIDMLYRERDPAAFFDKVRQLQLGFRQLETAGVPVVAALNGSALGGGFELALSCHRRIAIDDPRARFGLPEVSLGVLPGGGGTQRLPRLIGIQGALEIIGQGKVLRAPKALKAGLVHELVADADALRAAAEAWIAANPKAKQPWDAKGWSAPPPVPNTDEARNLFIGASAMVYDKAAGAMPAPRYALQAIHEGLSVSFDRGLEIEARYFTYLAVGDTAKDMIRTFWYHRTAIEKGVGVEPAAVDPRVRKLGVLGAGMMGAGLAWIAADKGLEVVVKDIAQGALDRGRAHAEEQTKKRRRHLAADAREALLGRITWTLDNAALAGCDLIIEAVIEDDAIKAVVTREVEAVLGEDAIFASNTSAIPITHLAKASARPQQFVGLHFFSPVEQMPLLEIIAGAETSEETLARSLGVARLLGKLPIVVNDGYGFFTSRVFAAYLMEAAQLVAEGHPPPLIEWAARTAGMVVAPLKVFDEVTLRLGVKAVAQRERYTGEAVEGAGLVLLRKLVELGRVGKIVGEGFYDYEGRDRRIWSGLADLVDATPERTGLDYVADRLMYAQIAEIGRVLDDGILRRHRDAEIGAIFGIGFAPASGGPLSWIDRRGAARVVEELRGLADTCGDRYAPSETLIGMAARGERFFEAV